MKVLRTFDGDGPTTLKNSYMIYRAQEELTDAKLPFISEKAANDGINKAIEIQGARCEYNICFRLYRIVDVACYT
jgi:hypothetical protein